MRLVFFGSGEFGLPTLRALASSHQIVGVITQPDRPAGRGRELTPTPIGAWSGEHLPGVPVFKPERVNEPAVIEAVRALPSDAWVVIAFGQKLSPALLEGRFAINLHASLLPRWRGAAPINAAVMAGDQVTGNSVITLADRMDAGLILAQSTRTIAPDLTAGTLHDLLASDGPALVGQVLDAHARGTMQGRAQDERLATRAPKLSKADSWVDFGATADECRRRVHGLTPWPGVSVRLVAGGVEQDLKVTQVEAITAPSAASGASGPGRPAAWDAAPGTLVDPALGVVACGGGTLLRLVTVTPAGKRAMAWRDFMQGRSIEAGVMVHGGRRA